MSESSLVSPLPDVHEQPLTPTLSPLRKERERRTAANWLSADEIARFVTPSDLHGALSVFTTWGLIAGAFTLLAFFPREWWAWLTSLFILGGRHLALAILMHEASHHSLFKTPWLNDIVGRWLCAYPVWQRLDDYRVHHAKHHSRTSLPDDPDLGLADAFPTSRTSLARKFLRDLSGVAFVRRVVGLLAMDAGFITYSASTSAQRITPAPSPLTALKNLARNTTPMLLTNLVLLGGFAAFGQAWLYGVWVLSWATAFSVFVRIRSIAEHGMTQTSTDALLNTRTTHANVLARLSVAPHHVNFHLEHHLLPKVPHHRLRELHALLHARGAYEHANEAMGYLEVLRRAVTVPAR